MNPVIVQDGGYRWLECWQTYRSPDPVNNRIRVRLDQIAFMEECDQFSLLGLINGSHIQVLIPFNDLVKLLSEEEN